MTYTADRWAAPDGIAGVGMGEPHTGISGRTIQHTARRAPSTVAYRRRGTRNRKLDLYAKVWRGIDVTRPKRHGPVFT